MFERLRKITLIVAAFAAIFCTVLLIETGKFESPSGLFLVIANLCYLGLFTIANKK